MKKKTKQIKLQPKYRNSCQGIQQIVPLLTLSGLWLEENGFKAGELVTIIIEKKLLIIKASEL